MHLSQSLMTLKIIFDNPGINLKNLANEMPKRYSGDVVRFLFLEENAKHLESIIEDLYCIENRKGNFYYNPELKPKDEGDIHAFYIGIYLENLRKQSPIG